ncbi:endonuclease/exonuclease/phosphatase family protein [Oryzifoliimicrobium ureilyticus]|uniref:endonuclease/exonuclease/phosphatase family protein n=1 Tax=Oryzifoliimicrobium ureilyticus TaxID=3113724 RepID=UPI0030762E8A
MFGAVHDVGTNRLETGSFAMTLKVHRRSTEKGISFTLLTYNVHSCVGTDRRLDPKRIADVIAQSGADIVALQEVDVGRKRTGGIDQAELIASHLKMNAQFHPALHLEEEKYGDAILTAFPMRLVKAGALPSIGETRGALWVRIDVGGLNVNVINTHLGLRSHDRRQQVNALMEPSWMGSEQFQSAPSIFCGDFNAGPRSPIHATLEGTLRNSHRLAGKGVARTFPSRLPLLSLDHVFVSDGVDALSSEVIANPLARRASDHLPLLASLVVEPKRASSVNLSLEDALDQ